MTTKKLTPKQELFIREYLVDMNATQAAIRAGYSADTAREMGSENLTKPAIAQRIQEAMGERFEDVEIKAAWVLGKIVETINRCSQAEPVLDREGNHTGEWKFDSRGALKGTELLARYLKLLTDRIEVEDKSTLAERLGKARKNK